MNQDIFKMIDIHILPESAQNELIDFYNFLVERYGKISKKNSSRTKLTGKQINAFFDQYNLDLTNFKLDRNSIYER